MLLIFQMWRVMRFFYRWQFVITRTAAEDADEDDYFDAILHKGPIRVPRRTIAEMYVLDGFLYRFRNQLPVTEKETAKIKEAQVILDACIKKGYLMEDGKDLYISQYDGVLFCGFVSGLLSEWIKILGPVKSFFFGGVSVAALITAWFTFLQPLISKI